MNPVRPCDRRRRALLRGLLAAAGLAALGGWHLRAGVRRICRAVRPGRYPGPLRPMPPTLMPGPWAG